MFRSLLATLLLLVVIQVNAFSPASRRASTFRSANFVSAAQPRRRNAFVLRMVEEEKKVEVAADGTFYDDEMDTAPVKDGISDSMKARLRAEASSGLDSEAKQSNVILYIIGAVAVLVVLGGAGTLY